jgi:hypothetical protein
MSGITSGNLAESAIAVTIDVATRARERWHNSDEQG